MAKLYENHLTKETAFNVGIWANCPVHFVNFTGVICYLGHYMWYVNNKKHRDDGPAVIYSDGSKQWLLDGFFYSQEEWFELLTPEEKEKALFNMDNW